MKEMDLLQIIFIAIWGFNAFKKLYLGKKAKKENPFFL